MKDTIRFVHTADIHLGMCPDKDSPWADKRRQDIWDTFHKIIDLCNETEADLLLIAGDVFHKQPTVRELKEADSAFGRLKSARVVMTAGNHDYLVPGSAFDRFEWGENVFFLKSDMPERVCFDDLGVEVVGFSYRSRKEPVDKLKRALDVSRIPSTDGMSAREGIAESADRRDGDGAPETSAKRSILLLHGGKGDCVPFDKGMIETCPYSYVALGHIHAYGKVTDRAIFPGSPEPLDRTETGEHGVVTGSLDRDGRVSTSFAPLCSRHCHQEILEADPQTTNLDISSRIKDFIASHGEGDIYSFTIKGFTDPDVKIDVEALKTLGNIASIEDMTGPDYDFEEMLRENRDNIIGMFIDRVRRSSLPDEVADRALYAGIDALLANCKI